MAPKNAASKYYAASDTYTRPVTHCRSKGIIQEQNQGSIITESILKQLMESSKTRIVIQENLLYDNSDSASRKLKSKADPDVMSFMMAIIVEAAMVEMERRINLMKAIEK
ncbi:ty3-gypsy retrotransposon protein [Cucumis melo var. makuwa]|uniref:Ty3-gypsy retrotransposon protein n=1 Tax=Cucumis melo var. makuwa TaxID=1194695 RepID=A0A5D3BYT8_CUCMM|nr:ty3-gypsy retrotransposon protein [Cucumis melo var. makuwa]